MRSQIDWPPILAYVADHPDEAQPAIAERFAIPLGTLKAKLARERATAPATTATEIDPATAAAVYVPLDELKPWGRNPKPHEDVGAIVASIIRFGIAAPLVARLADREIIAGHGRIKAARRLPALHAATVATAAGDGPEAEGARLALAKWHPDAVALATVARPCLPVRYRDMSPSEAHALALADNRIAELSGWDPALLAEGFATLAEEGADLTGLGWDLGEIEIIQNPPTPPGATPDPGPPPLDQGMARGPASSAPGAVYQLGPHRLLCGDNTDTDLLAKLWGDDVADIILTDPPFCSGGFHEAGRVIGSVGGLKGATIARDNLTSAGLAALLERSIGRIPARGCAYVFCDWRQLQTVRGCVEPLGYQYRALLVWDKGTPGMGGPWRHQHELVYFGTRRKEPSIGALGDVLSFARSGNEHHTTEKPIDLIEAILSNTEGGIVADPFAGSGVTLLAAARLGRVARVSEIDPGYCDVIRRRWTRWAREAQVDPGPGALE